jgi:hypothetical protein
MTLKFFHLALPLTSLWSMKAFSFPNLNLPWTYKAVQSPFFYSNPLSIPYVLPMFFMGKLPRAPVIRWKYPRKGQDIWVFLAKYRNLVWKIEVKSLEINYNVLVRKKFPLKFFSGIDFPIRAIKNICPGPPRSSRRPCFSSFHFLQ